MLVTFENLHLSHMWKGYPDIVSPSASLDLGNLKVSQDFIGKHLCVYVWGEVSVYLLTLCVCVVEGSVGCAMASLEARRQLVEWFLSWHVGSLGWMQVFRLVSSDFTFWAILLAHI